eukprot:1739683-Rhodomonas_salina.1
MRLLRTAPIFLRLLPTHHPTRLFTPRPVLTSHVTGTRAGFVHRDLKHRNVLFVRATRAWVLADLDASAREGDEVSTPLSACAVSRLCKC